MRIATVAAFSVLLLAADLSAQRRMRPGNQKRDAEITNRVGAFFTDIDGPATEGGKVAGLETLAFVRDALAAKQPVVLYLVDRQVEENTLLDFEWRLFQGDELGIELRCFHCGRIDLSANEALAARYEKRHPLFVIFDAKGVESEVAMPGFKPSTTALERGLERAARGMRPPLSRFTKQYEDFVKDLERLLEKRRLAEKAVKEADTDGKQRETEKELAELEAAEKELLAAEKKLIEEARLPLRSKDGKRVGGRRPPRDRRK